MTTNKERYSKSLVLEAKKLGYTSEDLDKYYNRGLTAWVTHKIPGSTPEQLAIAVVEEFLASEREKKFTIREEELVDDIVKEEKGLKSPNKIERKVKVVEIKKVDDKVINEWIESVRPKYVKRYGDKAEEKLFEAAQIFKKSKTIKEDWQPPKEPTDIGRPGTKRYSWELSNWHIQKLTEAKEQSNQRAIDYHSAKIEEYVKKAR